MKTRAATATALLAFSLIGCESLKEYPKLVETTVRVDGLSAGVVTNQLDEHTFEVSVFSASGLTDTQLLNIWNRKAEQLAAGRPYKKDQPKLEPWDRIGGHLAGEPEPRYPGTKVTGRIVIM